MEKAFNRRRIGVNILTGVLVLIGAIVMVRHEKRKRRIHNEELEIEAEKTRQ